MLSPQHERESLLTKAVRLTAGLVLRNLIRTVPEARRLVMLAILASLIPRPLSSLTEWNSREGSQATARMLRDLELKLYVLLYGWKHY